MRSSVFAITLVALLVCSGVAWSICPCTVTGTVDVPDQDCGVITLELWQYDSVFDLWSKVDSGNYVDDEDFSLGTNHCGGNKPLRLAAHGSWVTDVFTVPLCYDQTDVGTVTIPVSCPGGKEPPQSAMP